MDKSDYSQKINQYIVEFLKFADAKAIAILTFVGVLGGGVALKIEVFAKIFIQAINRDESYEKVLSVVALLLLIATIAIIGGAIYHCINALSPKPFRSEISLNSYPDIGGMSLAEYLDKMRVLDDKSDDLALNYAKHNHTLSRIALQKFNSIKAAILFLKFVILFAGLFALTFILLSIAV